MFVRCGLHCDSHCPVCWLLLQCHHCLVPPLPVLLHDKWAAMAQLWQQLEQPELHRSQRFQQINLHQWILHQVQDHPCSRVLWVSDLFLSTSPHLDCTLPGPKNSHHLDFINTQIRAFRWIIKWLINTFQLATDYLNVMIRFFNQWIFFFPDGTGIFQVDNMLRLIGLEL